MSLERILTALITQMQEVPGIGHLYAYSRLMIPPEEVQPGEVRRVFGIEDPTSTRGWSIQSAEWFRRGVNEQRHVLDGTTVVVTHHLGVRVYKEHNDAWQSEVQFRALLDAIRALLRTPHVIEPEAIIATVPQIEGEGVESLVILGDTYLCHQAIITVDTQEVTYQDDEGNWVSFMALDDAEINEGVI